MQGVSDSGPEGRFLLEREQRLLHTPEEVFPFFSDPRNLERITPPFLGFRVLGSTSEQIGEGTQLDYSLRLHGIPMRWRSRIVDWDPPHGFTDVQLRGPYRSWHHEHRFLPRQDGCLATDRVCYDHLGGRLVNRLLVAPDLERIFRFRQAALERLLAPEPLGCEAPSPEQESP